jgi:hypothetical protein
MLTSHRYCFDIELRQRPWRHTEVAVMLKSNRGVPTVLNGKGGKASLEIYTPPVEPRALLEAVNMTSRLPASSTTKS